MSLVWNSESRWIGWALRQFANSRDSFKKASTTISYRSTGWLAMNERNRESWRRRCSRNSASVDCFFGGS